jgi:hypothetical protein
MLRWTTAAILSLGLAGTANAGEFDNDQTAAKAKSATSVASSTANGGSEMDKESPTQAHRYRGWGGGWRGGWGGGWRGGWGSGWGGGWRGGWGYGGWGGGWRGGWGLNIGFSRPWGGWGWGYSRPWGGYWGGYSSYTPFYSSIYSTSYYTPILGPTYYAATLPVYYATSYCY